MGLGLREPSSEKSGWVKSEAGSRRRPAGLGRWGGSGKSRDRPQGLGTVFGKEGSAAPGPVPAAKARIRGGWTILRAFRSRAGGCEDPTPPPQARVPAQRVAGMLPTHAFLNSCYSIYAAYGGVGGKASVLAEIFSSSRKISAVITRRPWLNY